MKKAKKVYPQEYSYKLLMLYVKKEAKACKVEPKEIVRRALRSYLIG